MQACNHSSDTRLASDLLAALCSPKEMANSSLTGKTANVHKNIDGGTVRDKDKLDPTKVQAIYGIVYEYQLIYIYILMCSLYLFMAIFFIFD